MSKTLSLLFLLAFPFVAIAQTTVPLTEWIQARQQQFTSPTVSNAKTFRPSWIQQMEVRTETEDFNFGRQEYLFRFSPSTPRIRRAQAAIIALAKQELTLDQSEFQTEVMQYILEEVLAIRQLISRKTVYDQLLSVYEDEQKLLQKMLAEQSYTLKDLLQVESKIQELIIEQENEAYQMQLWGANAIFPATDDLIAVEKLLVKLPTINSLVLPKASNNEAQLELAQLNAERELEIAEQNKWIDFVQLRYDGPHSDLLQERLAVGVALELPYSASKKMKLEELQIEQARLNQEVEQSDRLDSLKIVHLQHNLQVQLDRWNRLQQLLQRQTDQVRTLQERGVDVAYESPELYLFQQEALLELQLKQLKIEEQIYENYLDLLAQSGLLTNSSSPQFLTDFILD